MTYPATFYYSAKSEEVIYDFSPDGQLDVNRMIQGKPYWKKIKSVNQLKNKTLVITDWRISEWSVYKQLHLIPIFNQLIDDGFTLYFSQGKQLNQLTKKDIPSMFGYHNATRKKYYKSCMPEGDIKETCKQHGLIPEQIHFIDDYEMSMLEHPDQQSPRRTLQITDIHNASFTDKILHQLTQNSPPLDGIILNHFISESIEKLHAIHQAYPHLEIIVDYTTLTINQEQCLQLLNTGKLTCNGYDFTLNQLSTLKGFHLIFPIDANLLRNLLLHTPQLKNLVLLGNPSSDFTEGVSLPNLQVLLVQQFQNSGAILKKLFSIAPNVQKIIFHNCSLLDDFAPENPLTACEAIFLQQTIAADPSGLFAKTPNAKTVFMYQSKCLHDFTSDFELPFLEVLDLTSSKFSNQNLKKLWKKTKPNTLCIPSAPKFENDFSQEVDLSSLHQLICGGAAFTIENLTRLLLKTSQLNVLYLTHVDLDTDFKNPLPLSTLETLVLSDVKLNTSLLTHTAKLKSLALQNCSFQNPTEKEIDCAVLEELTIFNTNITHTNLRLLLAKTTSFKRLTLINNPNLTEDFTTGVDFSSLESLVLVKAIATPDCFNKLFKQASALNFLSVGEIKWLPVTFFQELHFPSLETLKIAPSFYHLQLQHIINNAPKLKTLELTNLDIEVFRIQRQILPQLETLNLRNCTIKQNDLSHVLSLMPNLKELDLSDSRLDINEEQFRSLKKKFLVNTNQKTTFAAMPSPIDNPIAAQPQAPLHSAQTFLNYKPTAADFKFTYKGTNRSFNQTMVVEKLSQYLTVIGKEQHLIPKIQGGICAALSPLFLEHPLLEWFPLMVHWNGKEDSLRGNEPLIHCFNTLLHYVKKYFIQPDPNGIKTYLGDNLEQFLTQCPTSAVFSNPWHAIAVHYHEATQSWLVYDPNYAEGPKKCTKEELSALLQASLGSLVSIYGDYPDLTPAIKDTSLFIREGGLLVLNTKKKPKKNQLLALLAPVTELSPLALDGLLLRDLRGVPLWNISLFDPTLRPYTEQLMQRFKAHYPQDYAQRLLASLSDVPPELKQNHTPNPAPNAPLAELTQQLQTWTKTTPSAPSMLAYFQSLVGNKKKQLIELEHTEQVHAMHVLLEKYAQQVSHPIFYVNSPEDLICSGPFMRHEQSKGVLHSGPGGRLYDFLKTHQHPAAKSTILINYDNFDADDIARFNNLLETSPTADGVPLPAGMQIIGLINSKKVDVYQGDDFYALFEQISRSPKNPEDLAKELMPIPFIEAQEAQSPPVIQLYHYQDWKERLLGTWILKKNQFAWKEGALARALSQGDSITIHNGLWDNLEFKHFWQRACALGYIDYELGRITIPKTLKIVKHQGYDWQNLITQVAFVENPHHHALVVNPGCFNELFQTYHCDNQQKTLNTLPGLIERHAHQSLTMHLTRSLGEAEWAMILDECRKHQVQLRCYCAPKVTLPQPLRAVVAEPNQANRLTTWDYHQQTPHTLIIESKDPDTTIAMLTQKEPSYQVMNISECSASDLLIQLTAEHDKQTQQFQFNQLEKVLLQSLAQQKKIILTGKVSTELGDHLAPFLLSRHAQADAPRGELILISKDATHFNFLPSQQHPVDIKTKKTCLAMHFSPVEISHLIDSLIAEEDLSQLKARLIHRRIYGDTPNTHEAWNGLMTLPERIKLYDFDVHNSAAIAHHFNLKRFNAVNAVLKHAPYVFLTGLTGVGKSTFVERHFHNEHSSLYQGEAQLLAWTTDHSEKQKILFIDEANLSERQWSEFEGLFNNPPGILINGTYYPLSEKHKVIFAGNPVSYGDQRQLTPFFTRHGNALVFEPMPLEFIYEFILKPVFDGTNVDPLAVCHPLLKVYRFICEYSKDKVLLSPRELQMMALMVLSYAHQQRLSAEQYQQVAQYYAYQLTHHVVPKAHQQAFNEQFKPQAELPENPRISLKPQDTGFVNTASRQAVYRQLNELLALREYRRKHARNEAQAYGGLGGMLIEGLPGEGKSHLVIAALRAHGYQEMHCHSAKKKRNNNLFYRIPVSMPTEEKKRVLLMAFNEGAVAVIDGMNSAPMMERFLNSLLMGRNPEGKRPEKPGFLVIAPQHPATMQGRRAPSTALARRMINARLTSYPRQELHEILRSKGVNEAMIPQLLQVYETNLNYANQHQLSPAPTLINLLRTAERFIAPRPVRHPASKRERDEGDKMHPEEKSTKRTNHAASRPAFFQSRRQQSQPAASQDGDVVMSKEF